MPSANLPITVQSLFFPGQVEPALQLANATAALEFDSAGYCLERAEGTPADLALAVAEVEGATVTVRYWCVPLLPSSSLYLSARAGYGLEGLPGDVIHASFRAPGWLAILLEVGGEELACWLDADGLHLPPPVLPHLPPGHNYMGVLDLWTTNGLILVHVVTRRLSGTTSVVATAGTVSLAFAPANGTDWFGTAVDLTGLANRQYWVTTMPDGSTLFLPRQAGMPPADHALVLWGPAALDALGDAGAVGPVRAAGAAPVAGVRGAGVRAGGGGGRVGLAAAGAARGGLLRAGCVQLGPREHDGERAGQLQRAELRGCPDVRVQRLCLAYNKCALVNCVGTPVHQRKPLCGVGAVLRHSGQMALSATSAAWTVFAEMVGLMLDLNLLTLHEAELLWPEDAFLCHVCAARTRAPSSSRS